MFFEIRFVHSVRVPPRHLGAKLRTVVAQLVRSELEGTFIPDYGYIVCIVGTEKAGKPLVEDNTVFVRVPVEVKAIVFRPFKNEIVEGVVTNVSDIGCFVQVGCMDVFISHFDIGPEYRFDETAVPPKFVTPDNDESRRIQRNDRLRLKLTAIRIEPAKVAAMGSIREDYLGRTLADEV